MYFKTIRNTQITFSYSDTQRSLTSHIISDAIKWLPTGSCRGNKWQPIVKGFPVHTMLQLLDHWQYNEEHTLSLPSRMMPLICPNCGTWSGFPCMAEVSPALSRSCTKFSEYSWILDTLKVTRNVASTSPLMLLAKQQNTSFWFCAVDFFKKTNKDILLTHRQEHYNQGSDGILMSQQIHFLSAREW